MGEDTMNWLVLEKNEGVATLTLNRGKVNAIQGELVAELRESLTSLKTDRDTRALVLTGQGKFFSFGFDIPALLSLSKQEFISFLTEFTGLYKTLFLYPKPVVAALNGHTVAGGCMLALSCDYRLMVAGKAKISLNEIGLGASVFAGSTEMLRFWAGSANATNILCSGEMFSAEEALKMGIVQRVSAEEELMTSARQAALSFASKDPQAFASIKSLLRKPVAEEMARREPQSISEFADIWYSEATWAKLREVKIY